MTDNLTSQAAKDWLADTRVCGPTGVDAICQKYLRMETALTIISENSMRDSFRPEEIANVALAYDPLSHS